MFESVRDAIGRWITIKAIWWNTNRKTLKEISTRNCWEDIKNCLMIWPSEGLDISAGEIIIKKLKEKFPASTINIVALPGVGASVPVDFDINIVQLNPTHFNKIGLPTRQTRDNLLKMNAAITIDMSPSFNPSTTLISLLSQAPLSIGFAESDYDLPYNFQIATSTNSKGIDRYKVMAKYIG